MKDSKKNLLPQIFEPLAIVVILGLFLIPVLTVLNLSPITRENKQANVLGATSSPNSITIDMLNKESEIFGVESLRKQRDGEYVYTTEVLPREGGKEYSRQVFKITNKSNTKQRLIVDGYTDNTGFSNFSLKIDSVWYVLRDNSKEIYQREIVIEPNATKTLYLSTYSDNNTFFAELLTINIKVK